MADKMEVVDFAIAKKQIERTRYNDLVLRTFDAFEHADKRKLLDLKGETQIKARERL